MPMRDATALLADLASGRTSAVALARECLDSIASSTLGAFSFVEPDESLRLAAESDARRSAGRAAGPLEGLPVALKANMAVRHWPHTAGLRFRRDDLARDDAFIVRRLRAAGAVPIGLTAMDEGALGAEGTNPWYGTTHNPRRHGYSAGGSSSGAGAAVAAGLCAFALGTDTIGSVRIPASFCACVGLKPSYGLLSVGDVVPVHLRFDHVGPLTRSLRDLRWLLPALAGYDPGCPVSVPLTLDRSSPPLRGARIGYLTGLEALRLEPAVAAAYGSAVDAARRRGADLIALDATRWDLPRLRRAVLALCEVQMWREYGARATARPEDFSDGLRAFIRYGGKLEREEIDQAETRIAAFYREWQTATAQLAACLTPTTACRAFAHGERRPQNTADLTAIASATGQPALSMPLALPGEVLPAGLQWIGQSGRDLALVSLAQELEAELAVDGLPGAKVD
jgi:aspartyl-tRNA(Asn)/glutamyl-tRNA(Gln) amidotransferase subunit A